MCGILNFMQMNEYKSTNPPGGAEKPTQPPEGLHILSPVLFIRNSLLPTCLFLKTFFFFFLFL